MIIKKPYAFLIKHFRLIHLILSILMIYLVYKSNNLYKFFNDYAKENTFTYFDNLTTMYLGPFVFLSIVLILLLVTTIYLLMRWKNKSRKLYIFTFAYYIILFLGFLIFFNIIGDLGSKALDVRTLRIYRDVILLMYLPQYVFTVLVLIRATGFNIEKFNFKKDLEDLDIAEEDQEEIEVTVSKDTYKIPRFLRKQYKELVYYYKENKIYFYIVFIIIIGVFGYHVYKEIQHINSTYYESEYLNVNGISVKVVSSYVTNIDFRGNVLDKNKNYLIVKIDVHNSSNIKKTLNSDELILNIGNSDFYPLYSVGDYFKDIGELYYNKTIYASEGGTYILVYEISNKLNYKNSHFRILESTTYTSDKNISNYKDVQLSPKELFKDDEASQFNLKSAISLETSTLNNSSIIVNSYSIGDSFTENFEYCVSSCYNGKRIIKPDLLSNGELVVLKINTNVILDEDLYINKFIKSSSDFVNYFGYISYTINGKEKIINANVVSLDNIKTDNVYVYVPKEVKSASKINLYLIIRDKKYIINLSK